MTKYILLTCLLILNGCNAINYKSSTNHERAAYQEQQKGNWNLARQHFAKAIVNAELAGRSKEELAILNYEYGRSLGVTCFFDKSDEYLRKAYDLDVDTHGPYYNDLIELARLHLSQNKWEEAKNYYEEVMPVLQTINAPTQAPHAYADILDEYAKALDGLGNSSASTYNERATKIRNKYPGGRSITDITPYGSMCVN